MREARPRFWRDVAGLVVGLCLMAGGTMQALRPANPDLGDVPGGFGRGTSLVTVSGATPPPVAGTLPAVMPSTATRPPQQGTEPSRLRIPRLGVDALVSPVRVLAGGDLEVPGNPRALGWWEGGGQPGEAAGTTVIDGHVDTARDGQGAFFQLRDLKPGDSVEIVGRDGEEVLPYVVTSRRQYAKSALPFTEVFGPTPQPRLVLLTCGGSFDRERRRYTDNIAVYAVPRT